MIVRLTLRFLASYLMRWIWWLAPSTSASQVRRCLGSRRCASSKTRAITVAGALTMLAVSHLLAATGPGAGSSPAGRSWARMSAAVRGAGVASYTAPISAIRLWPSFAAADSRVLGLGPARAARMAALGRSASGRITIPLPSAESTNSWSALDRFGRLAS